MELPRKIVEMVKAESVMVHVKVCDSGNYELLGPNGQKIATLEDYVPTFFPEDHYGDYLVLNINLETGQIINWKKPEPIVVARAFGLIKEEGK